MNHLNRLNTALDRGMAKAVFDHLRNYLMCAFLFVIGSTAFKAKTGVFFGQIAANAVETSGIGIIGLSCVLFCLNFLDGARTISNYKFSRTVLVVLIILYAIMSIRTIELAWYFRNI